MQILRREQVITEWWLKMMARADWYPTSGAIWLRQIWATHS
ncbi:MAG: hypothetical protein ABSG00_08520 [Terracidiphilus sp.]